MIRNITTYKSFSDNSMAVNSSDSHHRPTITNNTLEGYSHLNLAYIK